MAFNFPDGAINGQKYTADNGLVYVYNGQVWLVDGVGTISSLDTRYLTIGGDGVISGSSQLTSSYDTRYTLSGSVQPLPSGIISGSSQLTSSYDTRYTLSGSVQPLPAGLISGSSQLTSSFATTGSNSFSGSQTITGSLIVSAIAVVSGGINVPTGSVLSLTSGSSISIDSSGAITGSLTGSVFGIGDVVAFSSSVDSRIKNIISTPAGTISGSSQLTSSFDTRYTLSGSVQPLPSGLISGSSQLTSSYDSRYSLSGSVLTSFSSSVDNRLDVLEASIISGSINYTQILGNRRTSITTVGVSIISGSITTTGNPVQIMVTGDANPTTTAWVRLQIFRDGNAIGNIIQVENSSNLNVPYCLNVIDTPSAGTYTYSMRTVDSMSGTFDFGEFTGPLLTAIELKSNTQLPSGLISGSSQLPSGIISGSSQLTASYDTRYTLSGSVQPLPSGLLSSSAQLPSGLISGSSQLTASYDTRYTLSGSVVSGTTPAGTISGSSQLTSSFDGRYLVTGSVTSSILQLNTFTASNANTSLNTFTSSLNIWSSSLATTGSNSFNGNQTITGSLIITTGSFFASQILANTSSLYLTSGSNLYVQNNGIAEISGSLRVSGSLALTGSISISSGSITMPNRPAFRITGNGGPTVATTVLSGSMVVVDYNEGGHYNTTNGTFTAPIAGLYQVNLVCRTYSNSGGASQAVVVKNNTAGGNGVVQIMLEWAANTTVNHMGGSTISKLAVGDTLKAVIFMGTSSFDGNDNFSVAYLG